MKICKSSLPCCSSSEPHCSCWPGEERGVFLSGIPFSEWVDSPGLFWHMCSFTFHLLWWKLDAGIEQIFLLAQCTSRSSSQCVAQISVFSSDPPVHLFIPDSAEYSQIVPALLLLHNQIQLQPVSLVSLN